MVVGGHTSPPMRFNLTLKLTILFGFSFGQTPEQIALDYYATNILNQSIHELYVPYHKNIKLRYDKRINKIDSQYQQLSRGIVGDYYECKISLIDAEIEEVRRFYYEWEDIQPLLDTITFIVPDQRNTAHLQVPKEIKFKKNLKYKNLKGGFMRFYAKKVWQLFFRERFNLKVEPHCTFNGRQYVWLRIDKYNREYGDHCIIEITHSQVTNWCINSWIQ
jgi:hypothetical protein